MEITFASTRVRRQCESERVLQRAHGQACARKLMARLADLDAAASLSEMRTLPGRCHELSGDRAGQLALELADGKRLVIEPANVPLPVDQGGGLDWARIDAVRILEIANYHRG